MNIKSTLMALGVVGTLLARAPSTLADGDETLGAPSIPIVPGTSVIAAGVGLDGLNAQPGTINFTVPGGAVIKQVLLYWEVAYYLPNETADNTIVVNSQAVIGNPIGSTVLFITEVNANVTYASFRADITSLVNPGPGKKKLKVGGLANSYATDGAGVFVIIDDGSSTPAVEIRDGLDFAYWALEGNQEVTQPQTFNFAAASVARTATLSMFFGTVSEDNENRPNRVHVTVGGSPTEILVNPLGSHDGDQWDTLTLEVQIPAGVTSLTVEAVSPEGFDNDFGGAASLSWIGAALSLSPVPSLNPGTGTPGFWKNHPEAWPTDFIILGGVNYSVAEAITIMQNPTKGDKTYNLFEHLVAARLNVLIGNESSCVDAAILAANQFLVAHPVGSNVAAKSADWKTIEPVFNTLVAYNEGKLCAPPRD